MAIKPSVLTYKFLSVNNSLAAEKTTRAESGAGKLMSVLAFIRHFI